jgi:hypothetical protein
VSAWGVWVPGLEFGVRSSPPNPQSAIRNSDSPSRRVANSISLSFFPRPLMFPGSGIRPACKNRKIIFSFSSLRRDRQITRSQTKMSLKPIFQIDECSAQLFLQRFTRIGRASGFVWKQWFAYANPDRYPTIWQPVARMIEPVRSQDHAWNDRFAGVNAQRARSGPHGCSLQNRLFACSNATFRKEADSSSDLQACKRFANRTPIRPVPAHGERTKSMH